MNKKIIYLLTAIIIISITYGRMSIKSNASDYAEEWLKKKQQQQKEYMQELEKDGNLTEEAYKSITKGNGNAYGKVNKKEKKEKKKNTSDYTIVYGVDELHVVGVPTNEEGYTKAGKYEK